MKTIFFLFTTLCFLKVNAQEKIPCCCDDDQSIKCFDSTKFETRIVKTVLYDYKTKNIAFPKGAANLQRGDAIRLKVTNFNPFVYKISIDGKDSSHPAIIDNNLLTAFTSLTNLSSLVGGISNSVITPIIKELTNKEKDLNSLLLAAYVRNPENRNLTAIEIKNPPQKSMKIE